MDAKLNHSELSVLLAKQAELTGAKAEAFTKAFFDIIIEGLEKDNLVKINGLGTFKITDVASRGSVDVNTGEKIEIKGHKKLSFIPADTLKDKVNRPFAMFEPVEIDESYVEEEDSEPETASENVEADEEENMEKTVPVTEEVSTATEDTHAKEDTVPIAETTPAEEDVLPVVKEETILEAKEEKPAIEEALPEKEGAKNRYPITENSAKNETEEKQKRSILIYIIPLLIAAAVVLFFLFYPHAPAEPAVEAEPVAAKTEEAMPAIVEEVVEQPVEPVAEEPYKFEMVEELAAIPTRSITIADTLHYSMQGEITIHEVAADETLARIALTYYGDRKLWPYIVTFNRLDNPNELCKGMELKIPRLLPKSK